MSDNKVGDVGVAVVKSLPPRLIGGAFIVLVATFAVVVCLAVFTLVIGGEFFGWKLYPEDDPGSVPSGAIVMTDQDCARLAGSWEIFEPVAGRFPIAAGRGEDDSGESRSFTVGDAEGAYQHQLREAEMPSHSHRLPTDGAGIEDRQTLYNSPQRDEGISSRSHQTSVSGGNAPHNNVPPYYVLNFCQHQ